MTDVLEALLRESDADENEWEYRWDTAGLLLSAADITGELQSGPELQAEALQRERENSLTQKERRSVQAAAQSVRTVNAAQTIQGAARNISDRMARLRQAAQRWEKRSLQPGSAADTGCGQDVRSVRGGVDRKRNTVDYAALVDAAFARDARRYDGPLRLL